MTELLTILKFLAAVLPFALLSLLCVKANLKKEFRSRQFAMPVLALVLCVAAMIFLSQLYNLVQSLLNALVGLIGRFSPQVAGMLSQLDFAHWGFFIVNFLLLLIYMIFKRIVITILKQVFKTGNGLYEAVVSPFYEYDTDQDRWFVRPALGQLRGYLKALYFGTLVICCLLMAGSATLYQAGRATAVFYPIFSVILVGELYFFLNGETKAEQKSELTVEEDDSVKQLNYSLMRGVLGKLFPDKLNAESTHAHESDVEEPMEQILDRLTGSKDPITENYGRFMQGLYQNRQSIDRNYLFSGLELLHGRSILFNNPFYWDYIPYIFYPINRTLLCSKRVLIVLGRNGTEEDIKTWIQEGLVTVNSTPDLWSVEVLTENMEHMPHIGILTRSDVHNQKIHEACAPFLAEAELAVVLEPSKLLSTAQIGLNSLAKRLQSAHSTICWCAIDKNCDGLVDALSHALMADLTEVSATEHPAGVSSYMLWDVDNEHMQHRLLPNISRYLGFGTELSFAALKNQISKTYWYGGEAFPVADMHWIAKQYYFDLLNYAELPATQQTVDDRFIATQNMWNAKISENAYLTVEDEAHNMFEMRRAFSTRASSQGFVNILSDDYLLKDYMAANADIFETDAKAIPHIVADYVRSERNVALRTVLLMASGSVREDALQKELTLLGLDDQNPVPTFWALLCRSVNPIGTPVAKELILPDGRGFSHTFDISVICARQKYDIDRGITFAQYYIEDPDFIRILVSGLQNADCIAEDERAGTHYLGSKLRGHIFQKYLPGQFLTMDGKYYEMLSVTPQGQMLVRRAADHIDGRVSYRQERNYRITAMTDSVQMGAVRDISGMKVTRAFADFTVETPAYWQMEKHSDFAGAKHIAVNGIPRRTYHNKQVLRIQLPGEGLTPEILYTVTVLFNEIFRSIFAENQPYLAAVMPNSEALGQNQPLTYTLQGDGVDLGENAIYILEDSQLDLGLLVSVERCLKRIFEIACDYLDWHVETLDKSLNPPPEPEVPDFRIHPIPEDGKIPQDKTEKKGLFGAIGRFFKKMTGGIGGFFKKIFGRKKKEPETPDAPEAGAAPGDPNTPETPAAEESKKKKRSLGGFFKKLFGRRKKKEPDNVAAPEAADGDGETAAEPDGTPEGGDVPVDLPAEEDETPDEEEPAEAPDQDSETPDETASPEQPAPEEGEPVLMSFSGGSRYLADEDAPAAPAAEPAAPAEEPAEMPEGMQVEFESDGAQKAVDGPVRLPYHRRYFLLFGAEELSPVIAPNQTLEYLQGLGYGNNSLKQARDNQHIAEQIERGLAGDSGQHLCDFCGRPLSGIEHEVLSDGRERCSFCGRTAVRSAEEFEKILSGALQNMASFFEIQINAPVHVQMVNAKKLHRKLGKAFVPTGNADGRILGVAIKAKDGYSILVENGAPRIQSTMTLVHELTHIWQYLNWDRSAIAYQYGKDQELEVYEGMAKWVEIQYAYLLGEVGAAKREELNATLRQDEYGRGFRKYIQRYPLRQDLQVLRHTPFEDVRKPL